MKFESRNGGNTFGGMPRHCDDGIRSLQEIRDRSEMRGRNANNSATSPSSENFINDAVEPPVSDKYVFVCYVILEIKGLFECLRINEAAVRSRANRFMLKDIVRNATCSNGQINVSIDKHFRDELRIGLKKTQTPSRNEAFSHFYHFGA